MAQIEASILNTLLGITESYQAPQALMKIIYDREKRENLMRSVLEAIDYDVSEDCFRQYFEDEHADRKKKKQDFTPPSISNLVARMVGNRADSNGLHYEPCAGTGGMTIASWNHDRMQHSPFDYRPSWYVYHCEELSERAIPFLIFNLAMRGMNAVVVHCDVISRKAYGAFFIQNDYDDHLQFSSINVLPRTQEVGRLLAVQPPLEWADSVDYEPLIESPSSWQSLPIFNSNNPKRGDVSEFTKLVYTLCGVGTEKEKQVEEDDEEIDIDFLLS